MSCLEEEQIRACEAEKGEGHSWQASVCKELEVKGTVCPEVAEEPAEGMNIKANGLKLCLRKMAGSSTELGLQRSDCKGAVQSLQVRHA